MSRLNKLLRWVLEPKHIGRTIFFTNTDEKVIGTSSINKAVYLQKTPEHDWELVASVTCKELVQL